MKGSDLAKQNPAIAAALQFHQQMQGGQPQGQPQSMPQAMPQGAQAPQPGQIGPDGKIPVPPDIQERMIILKAMSGHLQALDSVLKPPAAMKQGGA